MDALNCDVGCVLNVEENRAEIGVARVENFQACELIVELLAVSSRWFTSKKQCTVQDPRSVGGYQITKAKQKAGSRELVWISHNFALRDRHGVLIAP